MNSIQWTTEDAARAAQFVTEIQALTQQSGRDALPVVLALIEGIAALMVADLQTRPERLTCYLEALKQLVDHAMPTPIAVRDGEPTH